MNNLEKSLHYEEGTSDRVVAFARVLKENDFSDEDIDKSEQKKPLLERLKESLAINAFEKDTQSNKKKETHFDNLQHHSFFLLFLKKLFKPIQADTDNKTDIKQKTQLSKQQEMRGAKGTDKKTATIPLKELEKGVDSPTDKPTKLKEELPGDKPVQLCNRKGIPRKTLTVNSMFPSAFPQPHFIPRRNYRYYRDKPPSKN